MKPKYDLLKYDFIIVIDTQGYRNNNRKVKYNEMFIQLWKFFSIVIENINISCFISNATEPWLDILTKFIFTKVTSLFSDEIS